MTRGTTPVLTFGLPFAAEVLEKVYVTFVQGKAVVLEKSGDEVSHEGNALVVKLAQEDTLKLEGGRPIKIQIRGKDTGGNVVASEIIMVEVKEILKEGAI